MQIGVAVKLTDLDPRLFIASHAPGADDGAAPTLENAGAVEFSCPNGCTDHRVMVPLKPWQSNGWDREGTTLETLTLRPSIQVVGRCSWHGYVTNGEVTSV